jgi:hypothetical protein
MRNDTERHQERFWDAFYGLPNTLKLHITALLIMQTFGAQVDLLDLFRDSYRTMTDGFGLRVLVRLLELHERDATLPSRMGRVERCYRALAENQNLPLDLVDWLIDRRVAEVGRTRHLDEAREGRLAARVDPLSEGASTVFAHTLAGTPPRVFGLFFFRFWRALEKFPKTTEPDKVGSIIENRLAQDAAMRVFRRFCKEHPPVSARTLRRMYQTLTNRNQCDILGHPGFDPADLDAIARECHGQMEDPRYRMKATMLMGNPSTPVRHLVIWSSDAQNWPFLASNPSLPPKVASALANSNESEVLLDLVLHQPAMSAWDWVYPLEKLMGHHIDTFFRMELRDLNRILSDPRLEYPTRLAFFKRMCQHMTVQPKAHDHLAEFFYTSSAAVPGKLGRVPANLTEAQLMELLGVLLATNMNATLGAAMNLAKVDGWPSDFILAIYERYKQEPISPKSTWLNLVALLCDQTHGDALRSYVLNGPSQKEREQVFPHARSSLSA